MKYHLRLIKVLSYNGIVKASKKIPDVYTEDKETADKAVATGYFKLIADEGIAADDNSTGSMAADFGEAEAETVNLEDMSVQNIKEYANSIGVDIKGLTKKADIIAAIKKGD